MSALVMVLMAAMVVPGDMPEKVSGEVVLESQRLDLSGKWTGTAHNLVGVSGEVRLSKGNLDLKGDNGQRVGLVVSFTDEGKGRVRVRIKVLGNERGYLGIYQQDGDRLIACFGVKHRPRDFKPAQDELVFILQRARSVK